jgi:hypothetical protein
MGMPRRPWAGIDSKERGVIIEAMILIRRSRIRHKCQIVMCVVGILLLACEAERDNPLDPESPYYKGTGAIIGWVKTRTGEPISGMTLTVEPETTEYEFCFSNEEGFYEFEEVAAGSCKVIASKKGYAADSNWIEVAVGREDTVNFFLDILPGFTSCKVSTHHILQNYYACPEAEVFDGDGLIDIDSVVFWVAELPDTLSLEYDAGAYRKIIYTDDLPGHSLEDLIGKDCFFRVIDKAGKQVSSSPVRAARIIYETPRVVKPVNFEEVGQNPELVWYKADLSYPYTYTVEVTNIKSGMPPVMVWSKGEISAGDTTVTVPILLSPDYYYWSVWVVDEFGDRSRSKEAGFEVK